MTQKYVVGCLEAGGLSFPRRQNTNSVEIKMRPGYHTFNAVIVEQHKETPQTNRPSKTTPDLDQFSTSNFIMASWWSSKPLDEQIGKQIPDDTVLPAL
jgi:CDP-diacylglycerol pyrophosphatase